MEKSDYRWSLDLEEEGHGSPSVWGNRVFLNTATDEGKTREVICVNANKGSLNGQELTLPKTTKPIDSIALLPVHLQSMQRVYSVWGHSKELKVTAHSQSGKLVWKRDLGGVTGGHGFAVSPIIFEDLLIVPNDQEKGGGSHYAMDSATEKFAGKFRGVVSVLPIPTPYIFTPPKGEPELIFTNWWLGFTSLQPKTVKNYGNFRFLDVPILNGQSHLLLLPKI